MIAILQKREDVMLKLKDYLAIGWKFEMWLKQTTV